MEIKGSDGSKTLLNPHSTTLFGRSNGFNPNDPTVSRRHLSFDLLPSTHTQTDPRVSFEVLGKNPVWVCSTQNGEEPKKVKTFKRFQRGQIGVGDVFCVSAKQPVWFTLMEGVKEVVGEREGEIVGRVNDELSQTLEGDYGGDLGLDGLDVSSIDPVPEFGFLVIGHEFDHYPKQMICDVKNWDWFLEDPRGDSEEEDGGKKRARGGRRGQRKKTKRDDNDDANEEWTGESEDEEALTRGAAKVRRSTYETRSKDLGKPNKNRNGSKSAAKTSADNEEEELEEEDEEEDETLGGFIVTDDSAEEENDEDEDEEEEFVEDDDELED